MQRFRLVLNRPALTLCQLAATRRPQNRTGGAMTPAILSENIALNLAVRIYDCLKEPRSCWHRRSVNGYEITGAVPLSHARIRTRATAKCRIIVLPDWMDNTPAVVCEETWRAPAGGDWHIDNRGYICTELNLHWKDEIFRIFREKSLGPTAEFAARWLLNSTATLLHRQLTLFRGTIDGWNDSWDYWAHGTVRGEAEYRKQQKQTQRSSLQKLP